MLTTLSSIIYHDLNSLNDCDRMMGLMGQFLPGVLIKTRHRGS